MPQLNGTAQPSLALGNLQEIESSKLDSSDRGEAEKTVAATLASLFSGQYLLWCMDSIDIIVFNSRVRYCKSMGKRP